MEDQLTQEIIAAAFEVYRLLGSGYLEAVYEEALSIELDLREISYKRQVPLDVFYKEKVVGHYRMDLLIAERVVVELKANNGLKIADEVQLVNYLTSCKKDYGLLLNFSESKVQIKRKYRKYQSKKPSKETYKSQSC